MTPVTHHQQQVTHHRTPHSRTTCVAWRIRSPHVTNCNELTGVQHAPIPNAMIDNNNRTMGTPRAYTVDSAHTVNNAHITTHTSAHATTHDTMPLTLSNVCMPQSCRAHATATTIGAAITSTCVHGSDAVDNTHTSASRHSYGCECPA